MESHETILFEILNIVQMIRKLSYIGGLVDKNI